MSIWTDYSGMGGPELAVKEILDALAALGVHGAVRFYRARDMRKDCRQVLLVRKPPHGPEHVFGNCLRASHPGSRGHCTSSRHTQHT